MPRAHIALVPVAVKGVAVPDPLWFQGLSRPYRGSHHTFTPKYGPTEQTVARALRVNRGRLTGMRCSADMAGEPVAVDEVMHGRGAVYPDAAPAEHLGWSRP